MAREPESSNDIRERKEALRQLTGSIDVHFNAFKDVAAPDDRALQHLVELDLYFQPQNLNFLDVGKLRQSIYQIEHSDRLPRIKKTEYLASLTIVGILKGYHQLLEEVQEITGATLERPMLMHALTNAWGTRGTLENAPNDATRLWNMLYEDESDTRVPQEYVRVSIKPGAEPMPIPLDHLEDLRILNISPERIAHIRTQAQEHTRREHQEQQKKEYWAKRKTSASERE